MKRLRNTVAAILFFALISASFLHVGVSDASSLASESFGGISTAANAWISGGSGSIACLTAATTSASNSIPACSGGPFDSVGNGVLQLTPDSDSTSGFAIYNTPVSTSNGLQINFNMYQYGGTGADGMSFFLINGADSPTEPGAVGGGLGYSNNDIGTAGIVGGYVGVGFDKYGNFSSSAYGTGGPGREPNSIVVRGDEASGYQYVTGVSAAGDLEGTTRTSSALPVEITISSSNIMSVAVNYGSGYVTELSDINLNTINGAGSLPASFKFGFAASTGSIDDTHAISGLTVNTDPPDVSTTISHTGNFTQGTTGQFTIGVSNDAAAEATTGSTTISDTLPTGLTPTAASGGEWSCNISGQTVTCTMSSTLASGASAPNIILDTAVAANASSPLTNTVSVSTPNNGNTSPTANDQVTVLAGQNDGIPSSVKNAGPNGGDANNDGIPDSQQNNVSSFVDPITNKYVVLDTTADPTCTGNSAVSIDTSSSVLQGDKAYTYPAGLMNFTLTCPPGTTATVTMYYYGFTYSKSLILRKYDPNTDTYSTITGATFSSVTIGGQQVTKITYQIADNGPLDDNSTPGIITDPAGPAIVADATTPNTGNGGPLSQTLPFAAMSFSILAIGSGLVVAYRQHKLAFLKNK